MLFQVEPYFTSLALFDARAGRKLSENFNFDVNEEQIRGFLSSPLSDVEDGMNGDANISTNVQFPLPSELEQVSKDWIRFPKRVSLILCLTKEFCLPVYFLVSVTF